MKDEDKNKQEQPRDDEPGTTPEFSQEPDRPTTHAEFREAARKAMTKHAKAFANLAK